MSPPWPGVPMHGVDRLQGGLPGLQSGDRGVLAEHLGLQHGSILRIAGPLRTPRPSPSAVTLCCVLTSAAYPGVLALATFCDTPPSGG